MVKYKDKYSKIIIEKNRINLELLKLEIKLKKIIRIIYKKLSEISSAINCENHPKFIRNF